MRLREPASFWRENVIVVVILRLGKGLTSFTKDNSANFSS